jgi:hypothetical protein
MPGSKPKSAHRTLETRKELLVKGLHAFIKEHLHFPNFVELLESVNEVGDTSYSMSWLQYAATDTLTPTNKSVREGLRNVARDRSTHEAAVIDGWLYTDYPGVPKGVVKNGVPLELALGEGEAIENIPTVELVRRIAEMSSELMNRMDIIE